MAKQSLEILESLNICENPHAFLLVIRNDSRWSQEDLFTKDALEITFGPKFLQHTIVVITHVDNKTTDTEFEEKWKTSEKLASLIESCDKRVARIDNTNLGDGYITAILSYVNKVSEDGQKSYSYAFQDCNRQILEEIVELGTFDGKKAHEQVTCISREMKKAMEREQFMTDLNRKIEDLKDRERALDERERALDGRKIHDDKMHQQRIDDLNEMKKNAEESIKCKDELARNKEAEGVRRIKEAETKANETVEAAKQYANSINKGALVATAAVGVASAASGGITASLGIGAIKAGVIATSVSLSSHLATHLASNVALKWLNPPLYWRRRIRKRIKEYTFLSIPFLN